MIYLAFIILSITALVVLFYKWFKLEERAKSDWMEAMRALKKEWEKEK